MGDEAVTLTIHGLTVCVGYSDFLARGIARWCAGLASLTVVTAPGDDATVSVATAHSARVVVTDLFYRDGAAFNKGRAMEEARRQMPWTDWTPGSLTPDRAFSSQVSPADFLYQS